MDPAQLVELERWCEVMFVKANDPAQMAEAQRRIVPLGESAEFIPQCQYIIEHSTSSYALLIGAQSLTRLITSHWNSFTIPQRVDIRKLACPWFELGMLLNLGAAAAWCCLTARSRARHASGNGMVGGCAVVVCHCVTRWRRGGAPVGDAAHYSRLLLPTAPCPCSVQG